MLSTKARLWDQMVEEDKVKDRFKLHCGYKNCQFSTDNAKGLRIHRARIHRHK